MQVFPYNPEVLSGTAQKRNTRHPPRTWMQWQVAMWTAVWPFPKWSATIEIWAHVQTLWSSVLTFEWDQAKLTWWWGGCAVLCVRSHLSNVHVQSAYSSLLFVPQASAICKTELHPQMPKYLLPVHFLRRAGPDSSFELPTWLAHAA